MRSLIILAVFIMPVANASDGHYDYARVLGAEAITENQRVAVKRQVCAAATDVAAPGDARRERPTASIGDLIRADNGQRQPVCRNVTDYEQRSKTVGWRVRYRYRGKDYIRRMATKPGERLRVRVSRQGAESKFGEN